MAKRIFALEAPVVLLIAALCLSILEAAPPTTTLPLQIYTTESTVEVAILTPTPVPVSLPATGPESQTIDPLEDAVDLTTTTVSSSPSVAPAPIENLQILDTLNILKKIMKTKFGQKGADAVDNLVRAMERIDLKLDSLTKKIEGNHMLKQLLHNKYFIWRLMHFIAPLVGSGPEEDSLDDLETGLDKLTTWIKNYFSQLSNLLSERNPTSVPMENKQIPEIQNIYPEKIATRESIQFLLTALKEIKEEVKKLSSQDQLSTSSNELSFQELSGGSGTTDLPLLPILSQPKENEMEMVPFVQVLEVNELKDGFSIQSDVHGEKQLQSTTTGIPLLDENALLKVKLIEMVKASYKLLQEEIKLRILEEQEEKSDSGRLPLRFWWAQSPLSKTLII